MFNNKYAIALCGLLLPLAYAQAENNISPTPPNAKPGECYAKVVLPAEYETVEEKVLVKEASNKIEIIPAQYDTIGTEVEVVPEVHKLTPVDAVYEEISETVEVKPAYMVWRHAPEENATLVSPTILAAAKAAGVDINGTKPGVCYREYYMPRKFVKETEQIMVQEERNETKIIPPQFEDAEETITVKPASKKVVEVPAVYEEVEEKVLVSPERTMWKKGVNPAQTVSGATGDIMCLVKVPAKYKTIKKRVLKEPATTIVEEIPAETTTVQVKKLVEDSKAEFVLVDPVYVTIEKTKLARDAKFVWHISDAAVDPDLIYSGEQICLTEEPAETIMVTKSVLKEPARVESEIIPSVTQTVEVQKLIEEAQEINNTVPAEYAMVSKKKKVKEQTIGWKRILCQTNMSKDIIANIQSALNANGYNAGTPDGVLGDGTKKALEKFQKDNNLATGGLTYETLKALGVK